MNLPRAAAVSLRASARGCAGAALALTCAACSPLASFRPASGFIDDRSREIGAGAIVAGSRPYVDEPPRATAQLWFAGKVSEKVTLTGISAFDASAFALGGAARLTLVKTDRFATGGEVEGGWLWGGIDLPVAARLFDQTWIYTAPRFGNRGLKWAVDVPAGLSIRIYEGWMLRAEGRISWAEASYAERRLMLGGAAACQF